MSLPPIAIVGAGYAGLSCAVELARAGLPVNVFERSHTLGGRARVVSKDGWRVDNGQHILLGAYSETQRLLRVLGVSPKWLDTRPLTLHYPGLLTLRAAALPAPFHLAWGLARAEGLSLAERWSAIRFLRWLKHRRFVLANDCSVTELLGQTRQPPKLNTLIWEPLCVAALNTPADRASAQIFVNVLRDSLAADARASELLIPRVDLSDLLPVPAARYLATRRGQVRTTTAIEALEADASGLRLQGDPASRAYRHVVLACAPYHAAPLLATLPETAALARTIEGFAYEPITTVYLAYAPGQPLPEPMIGLSGGPGQWAFDRDQLGGHAGLLAVVISAGGPHEQLSREALVQAVQAQLERNLGRSLPQPLWHQVIVEKRATFAAVPGLVRPGVRTGREGLWLAGDYVASDYPATIESAVRSGVAAAGQILAALG